MTTTRLSFYFKAPMHAKEVYLEHDLFIQLMKLKNTLRYMKGEELITHLGREYYDERSRSGVRSPPALGTSALVAARPRPGRR